MLLNCEGVNKVHKERVYACLPYLPRDLVYAHILPRCSIDTRRAFGIPPRRLALQHPYSDLLASESESESESKSEFTTVLRLRYLCPQPQPNLGGHIAMVPLHRVAGWRNKSTGTAHLNLMIYYDFGGYRKYRADRDAINVRVTRIDYRLDAVDPADPMLPMYRLIGIREPIARFWIRPRQVTKIDAIDAIDVIMDIATWLADISQESPDPCSSHEDEEASVTR